MSGDLLVCWMGWVVCCNAFVCLALAWGLAFCLVLLIYG